LRYFFDITTTACWHGTPVGIARVEQELASRARRYLGPTVAFCIFDRQASRFVVLDEKFVSEVLSGNVRLDFEPSPPVGIRRRPHNVVLRNAKAYRLLQYIRGRPISRDQVAAIQADEFRRDVPRIPISLAAPWHAKLDSASIIISGGLDWNFKDLRSIWKLKRDRGFMYVPIIYDLIPIRFPQFVPPSYVDLVTDYFGELTWLADLAMCISKASQRDWLDHVNLLNRRCIPSQVFALGCDPESVKRTESPGDGLPFQLKGKRFVLYVSTIEPRKNHRLLYQAWEECIRANRVDSNRDRLVFVGRRGWAVGDLLHEIETNPLTRDTIVLLHGVPDAQLGWLYRNCEFVLFPSLVEGFGLPVVEALAHGKLCLTTDGGVLSEVGGELVIRLNPRDTLGWAATIARLMADPSETKDRENRIRTEYRSVTWDDSAAQFFGLLRDSVNLIRDSVGVNGPEGSFGTLASGA
jgi:glycosyltransferase involved in cell wall biosynthesis